MSPSPPEDKEEAAPLLEAAGSGERFPSYLTHENPQAYPATGREGHLNGAGKNGKASTRARPLYDEHAEKGLLGALLTSKEAITVSESLSAEHFSPQNGRIFSAIAQVHYQRLGVDIASVVGELTNRGELDEIGGSAFIVGLIMDAVPSPTAAAYYVGALQGKYEERSLHGAAQGFAEDVSAGKGLAAFDKLKADLDKLAARSGRETSATVLAKRRFNLNAPPPKPRPIFELNDAVIATPGNLVVVSSQAKVGKTAFLGAMIASTLGHNGDTFRVSSRNPDKGALVHFDTEQSPADHHSVVVQALRRAGCPDCPDWFRSYRLADIGTNERLKLLRDELDAAKRDHGSIHSVLIDGIADLCHDPNDSAEAFALVAELHTLAIRFDTVIVCILHENPGALEGKTRGHLGSQLERKAETNLRLSKDGEATVVFTERSRHAYIPKDKGPRFAWSDEAKMHVSVETPADAKTSARLEALQAVASEVFRDVPEKLGLTWEQLHERIEQAEGISRGGARKKCTALLGANLIYKGGDKYRLA